MLISVSVFIKVCDDKPIVCMWESHVDLTSHFCIRHWKYKILDLSVDKVSVARDGRKATVEAHIKERAELIDQGRKADWYSTSYSVQYELSMHKQGWKISSSRVVYESK